MIRVVLTGSECTGKTTLAQQLAEDFDTVWVPEYVRAFYDRKGAPLTYRDVEPIAQGVLRAEESKTAQANGAIILDTDILSTVIYSHHYYGDCPAWIEHESVRRAADLYLLLEIDVPWVPDHQRDRGDARLAMQALFRTELEKRRLPFVVVTGSWDDRRAQARAAIDELMRSRIGSTK